MTNNKFRLLFSLSRFMWRIVVLLAVLLSLPPVSLAAEPMTIIITGSNIPVEEQLVASSVYVIQREQIEKLNPRSVAQLLQSVPGLYVENSSSKGTLNTVYLRGAEPNYTLVLIDGIKVNDPSNSRGGAFDFSLLDIGSIERIEVVKGAFSSVYGSDAMAGVVNIITRGSDDMARTSGRLETGSRGILNAQGSVNRRFEKAQFAVNVAYNDDGEQVKGSEFISRSINANGIYDIDAATQLSMNAYYLDAETQSFPEASGGDKYAVLREVDETSTQQQQYAFKVNRDFNNKSALDVQLSYFQNDERFDSPGVDSAIPAYNTDTVYQRDNLKVTYLAEWSSAWRASVGLEMEWEKGESDGVVDPAGIDSPTDFQLDRRLYASFVELQYHLSDNLLMMAGVRVDAPEDFDNEVSPRLGVSYRNNATTYRASWSEGYKLPSFFALAHPIVGNPDFDPETSESFEIGLHHSLNSFTTIDAALFNHTYYDLIDFDDSDMLVQRAEVVTKGIELSIVQALSDQLTWRGHVTALQFDIRDSSDEVLKRPDRTAGLSINWQMSSRLEVSGNANYIGPVRDFAYPTGEQMLDSYIKVDLACNWQWDSTWRGQLALDNLLDTHFENAVGFEAQGIGARLAVTGNF